MNRYLKYLTNPSKFSSVIEIKVFGSLLIILVAFLFYISVRKDYAYEEKYVYTNETPTDYWIIDGSNETPFKIFMSIELPKWSEKDEITVEVYEIMVANTFREKQADEICIDQFFLSKATNNYDVYTSFDFGINGDKVIKNKICQKIDITDDYFTKSMFEPVTSIYTITFPYDHCYFYYPFDKIMFKLALQITYHLSNDGEIISRYKGYPELDFYIKNSLSEESWYFYHREIREYWSVEDQNKLDKKLISITEDPIKNNIETGAYTLVDITFKRSTVYRFALPMLVIFIVVLIASLHYMTDLGIFFQASFALLFGIFTIRQLFIPPEVKDVPTFIDTVIFYLYFLYGISLTVFIFGLVTNKIYNSQNLTKRSFVSILSSSVYHIYGCRVIRNQNSLINFSSESEAKERGYRPCRICLNK